MRRSAILLSALTFMAASVLPAMADTVSFFGTDTYSYTSTAASITFTPGQSLNAGDGTGVFSAFNTLGNNYSQWQNGNPTWDVGTNAFPAGIILDGDNGVLFSFATATTTDSYDATTDTLTVVATGTVYINLYSADPSAIPSTFVLTTQGGAAGNPTTYSATLTTVPEPTSVALLGTGLLGFAGVVRRKFKA